MIDGFPLIGLTAPTLLGIAILFLLMGRIIPRSTYLDKSREAERWREAYEKEREARARSNAQTVELLEGLKTNHAVISAMFQTIQRLAGSGESDVGPKA